MQYYGRYSPSSSNFANEKRGEFFRKLCEATCDNYLQFLLSFLFINKNLRLNNLKTKTAIDAKILVFVICVEAIIYLLLYNLHDCNFEFRGWCNLCRLSRAAISDSPYTLLSFHKTFIVLFCRIKLIRFDTVVIRLYKVSLSLVTHLLIFSYNFQLLLTFTCQFY